MATDKPTRAQRRRQREHRRIPLRQAPRLAAVQPGLTGQETPAGAFRTLRNAALWHLLRTTGMRIGEAVAARLPDLHLDQPGEEYLEIPDSKNGSSREVDLNGSADPSVSAHGSLALGRGKRPTGRRGHLPGAHDRDLLSGVCAGQSHSGPAAYSEARGGKGRGGHRGERGVMSITHYANKTQVLLHGLTILRLLATDRRRVPDLAKLLKVHPRSIYRYLRAIEVVGFQLEVLREGREKSYRVRPEAVESFFRRPPSRAQVRAIRPRRPSERRVS